MSHNCPWYDIATTNRIPLTLRRQWDTSTRLCRNGYPSSSAMCSNDDNNWPVHSLVYYHSMIYGFFLCNDYHLPFGSVSRQQTWQNNGNLWHLTVDKKNSRHCLVIIYIPLFCVLGMIHQAYSWSTYFQSLGFAFPGLPSTSSSSIYNSVDNSFPQTMEFWEEPMN